MIGIQQLQTKKTLELCLLRIEKFNLDFTCLSWWKFGQCFHCQPMVFSMHYLKTFEEIVKAYMKNTIIFM